MNPRLAELLASTGAVMQDRALLAPVALGDQLYTGVDLGTAYTVLLVVDRNGEPVAGAFEFAQVVRDGLVVDFVGAVDLLSRLRQRVEARLGRSLLAAASAYPPGVPRAEVRATANVIYAAGLECTTLVDEPTAANNVLQIRNGAIVDVGGGTTGIAVVEDGEVTYTADEPTGGTHFTLVIAGARDVPFGQAEKMKVDPTQQRLLFPVIRPVMEKVGTIVRRHVSDRRVDKIYLVGGACAFPGMEQVIEEITGIPTCLPGNPLFVTPLGIALQAKLESEPA